MPIEGFTVLGAGYDALQYRTPEDVLADMVTVYQKVAEKAGTVVAIQTIRTQVIGGKGDNCYRDDTYFIVDIPGFDAQNDRHQAFTNPVETGRLSDGEYR